MGSSKNKKKKKKKEGGKYAKAIPSVKAGSGMLFKHIHPVSKHTIVGGVIVGSDVELDDLIVKRMKRGQWHVRQNGIEKSPEFLKREFTDKCAPKKVDASVSNARSFLFRRSGEGVLLTSPDGMSSPESLFASIPQHESELGVW